MNVTLRELIARCKQDDQDAITELVVRFRAYAFDLANALLTDHALAEDAVQEAFMTALRRLNDLRESAAFPGWFRQIVRTECNRIRRKRREATEDPTHVQTVESDVERRELCDLVQHHIRDLPPALSKTTELFYLEERSCAEVASRLNIPQGTVRRRLHTARNKLRATLADIYSPNKETES